MSAGAPDMVALLRENAELSARLREAEDTLQTIRNGEVDALVVGDSLYRLDSAIDADARLHADVLSQVEDGVLAFDNEHHLIFMNAAAERLYGRRASDTLGLHVSQLYVAQPSGSAGPVTLTGPAPVYAVHEIADGTRLHVESTISELRDGAERRLGYLAVVRDIGERIAAEKTLSESQAQLRFTIEAAKVGDWCIDLADGSARHSLQHDRCFGYDRPVSPWNREIMVDHVHPDDRDAVRAEFERCIASRDDLHFECRVIWPDRSLHWIDVRGRLYDGEGTPPRLLGIVSDATERKTVEQALRDADRRKDEFLATLAHELRNPLAPIAHALEIVRRTRNAEAHENAHGIIARQVRQMVHLVDDLLDVSRITQGKLELRREAVDIGPVIQTAIETSRPMIDSGGHELIVRLPDADALRVSGDATRLCQIVANLLNNAAKYTPGGGRIQVSATREAGFAVVEVCDSGAGIPPQLLPRVFDMFAQVDRSLARSQGGLGIGLALVKWMTEAHGGTVQAYSEGANRGCRFVIRIPLLPDSQDVPGVREPAAAVASDGQGLRVLVVDDNADSVASLSLVLDMMGYRTRTAGDGLEAVQAAAEFQPRVALLDIGLPKLNGYEVARRIRAQDGGRDVVLIAISGWGQDEDRRKSSEAGFDHHFVKPVNLPALFQLMAQAAPKR